MRTLPAYNRRVLAELARVEYGHTTTYGTLAAQSGNPRAARAVGTVMHRNPVPIVLPCHRVVGANGKLTGYAGGLDRKEQLLRLGGRDSLALERAPVEGDDQEEGAGGEGQPCERLAGAPPERRHRTEHEHGARNRAEEVADLLDPDRRVLREVGGEQDHALMFCRAPDGAPQGTVPA